MFHTLRKLGRMDYVDLRSIAALNINTYFQSNNLKDFLLYEQGTSFQFDLYTRSH
jgi:hypothetical protein